ncbi:uncharacterized protein BDZ83DRAFT_74158 [Colletotrichum acutatum]|uniref:Uncharacterized protein n=1 Tax=Glomerella acutata TaxID=27357 RepID=A0AAD8UDU4_GLOAC|nr:uncharacterized protein BDZ83DRAFT_74158 [Colletotrichum acutatum]KAK1714123.1 hypothetical protein BDZ83DRAFT_74158 [Colletotrichum acutatum]
MVDGVQTLDSRERHCRVAKKKSNLQILGLCQSLGKFKGDHWSSVSLAQKVGRKSVLAPRELIALGEVVCRRCRLTSNLLRIDRVCDAASVTISVRWVGFLVGHVNFQVLKLKSRQGRLLTADVKVAAAKKRFSAQETKLQTHLTKKAESLRRCVFHILNTDIRLLDLVCVWTVFPVVSVRWGHGDFSAWVEEGKMVRCRCHDAGAQR